MDERPHEVLKKAVDAHGAALRAASDAAEEAEAERGAAEVQQPPPGGAAPFPDQAPETP